MRHNQAMNLMYPIISFLIASASICWLGTPAHGKSPSSKTVGQTLNSGSCIVDSSVYRDAKDRLSALHKKMSRLKDNESIRSVYADLKSFRIHPCLAYAPGYIFPDDKKVHAMGLKHFWNRGAQGYFETLLALLRPATAPRHFFPLPGIPVILGKSAEAQKSLEPLLCPVNDETCARQTNGWRLRAQDFFEQKAKSKTEREREKGLKKGYAQHPEQCLSLGRDGQPPTHMGEWMQCVQGTAMQTTTLPLGRLRVPKQGWMVIRGRRGHYRFCDEIGAYHLGTGATYVVSSCSGLFLRRQGRVDQQATNARRQVQVKTGRVSVDNLREAVWMLLLAEHVGPEIIVQSTGVEIPTHLPFKWTPSSFFLRGDSMSFGSNQTQLSWTLHGVTNVVATGALTWPRDPNQAAYEHAAALIQVAEESFVEGCAPARLPKALTGFKAPPGVSRRDAGPGEAVRAHRTLGSTFETLVQRPHCP